MTDRELIESLEARLVTAALLGENTVVITVAERAQLWRFLSLRASTNKPWPQTKMRHTTRTLAGRVASARRLLDTTDPQ